MNPVGLELDYNTDGSVTFSGSQRDREDIRVLCRVWDTQCQIGPETADEASSEEGGDSSRYLLFRCWLFISCEGAKIS